MYTVTFYSFKGGVGRTMALVNVAADLTKRGRKVLVVDFDLEAPGLQTYSSFQDSENSNGVVDYITDYISTNQAPDVSQYITEHKIMGLPIWLMSAGRQDSSYSSRFNAINWLQLYEHQQGYLLFEDLKQQWRDQLQQFDYVLVDSRTGHTDVGGICTRQIPDAVVLMFIPNEQNISGLVEVARNVRMEQQPPREANIAIHFCPSNVPDLDDEDSILSKNLELAKSKLEFDQTASSIHHYNSMALLDQRIFVEARPRTRLANEYRLLVDAVISENYQDREGVLSKLDKFRTGLRTSGLSSLGTAQIENALSLIYPHHPDDGEVAWSMANVYSMIGNLQGELKTLGTAIQQHANELRARQRRAQLFMIQNQTKYAAKDLEFIIGSSDAKVSDITRCIQLINNLDDRWLELITSSYAVKTADSFELSDLAATLLISQSGAIAAVKILSNYGKGTVSERHSFALACVSIGEFEQAMALLAADEESLRQNEDIADVFNYACAKWGATGRPSEDLFRRVLELGSGQKKTSPDPNFWQCLALASGALGDSDGARKYLMQTLKDCEVYPPTKVFTCWQFFYVDVSVLVDDVRIMNELLLTNQVLCPSFLRRAARSIH